jgi:hypothetical protein
MPAFDISGWVLRLAACGNSSVCTGLLIEWRGGDNGAVEQLIPLVHHELRRLAQRH